MSLTWLRNEYVELNDTYPLWERLVIGNRRLDIPVIYINEPFLGNGIVGQQVIADEFEEMEQHMSSIGHIFIVNGRVDDDRRNGLIPVVCRSFWPYHDGRTKFLLVCPVIRPGQESGIYIYIRIDTRKDIFWPAFTIFLVSREFFFQEFRDTFRAWITPACAGKTR